MTTWHHYCELDACIENETDWTGERVTGSFVIVSMTDDRCRLDTAVCKLTLLQARRTALELLGIVACAEAANARSGR
ncbi:MAG: hypothetical protein ABSG43_29045 [Solirubrobacteraceae bacterium]|jgi:hypothetical protein